MLTMVLQILGAIALLALSTAAESASVTIPGSTLDEIVARQSAGLESTFFGPTLRDGPTGDALVFSPYLGGYGQSGILSGIGVTWQTDRVAAIDTGFSVGFLDADFSTWTFAGSATEPLRTRRRSRLDLEAAAGLQFYVKGSGHTALMFPNVYGGSDAVLLDSFRFVHFLAHLKYTYDFWIFHPIFDLGLVGTVYQMQGSIWNGSFPIEPGSPRDESGGDAKVTFGLGVAVGSGNAFLFAGIKGVSDAGLFLGSLGLRF